MEIWLLGAWQNGLVGAIQWAAPWLVMFLVWLLSKPMFARARKIAKDKYDKEVNEAEARLDYFRSQENILLKSIEERSSGLISALRRELEEVKSEQRHLIKENASLHREISRMERNTTRLIFELVSRQIAIPPLEAPESDNF